MGGRIQPTAEATVVNLKKAEARSSSTRSKTSAAAFSDGL
jgi:hypothetical protein